MPPGIPPIPPLPDAASTNNIEAEAARIVTGINLFFTVTERRYIAAYGRCLLLSTKPSQQQTLRFVNTLRRYAPFRRAVGRLGSNLAARQQLQNEIARRVASGE